MTDTEAELTRALNRVARMEKDLKEMSDHAASLVDLANAAEFRAENLAIEVSSHADHVIILESYIDEWRERAEIAEEQLSTYRNQAA